MKLNSLFASTLAFAASLCVAAAQSPFGGPGAGMDSSMNRIFGDIKAFSASMQLRLLEADGHTEKMNANMKMAMNQGKVRMEMDMGSVKSSQIPPQAIAQMKSMGMDQNISIIRPDRALVYVVFPGLQAYMETPGPLEDPAGDAKAKTEKTPAGEETIDGHPCVKNNLTVTDAKGGKFEAITWNATDLKDFPIKAQFTEKGMTCIMLFKDVNQSSPADSKFEPPAGFTKCSNQQELMQAAMRRMMNGGGGGGPPTTGTPPTK